MSLLPAAWQRFFWRLPAEVRTPLSDGFERFVFPARLAELQAVQRDEARQREVLQRLAWALAQPPGAPEVRVLEQQAAEHTALFVWPVARFWRDASHRLHGALTPWGHFLVEHFGIDTRPDSWRGLDDILKRVSTHEGYPDGAGAAQERDVVDWRHRVAYAHERAAPYLAAFGIPPKATKPDYVGTVDGGSGLRRMDAIRVLWPLVPDDVPAKRAWLADTENGRIQAEHRREAQRKWAAEEAARKEARVAAARADGSWLRDPTLRKDASIRTAKQEAALRAAVAAEGLGPEHLWPVHDKARLLQADGGTWASAYAFAAARQ